MGFFDKLKKGLFKTKDAIVGKIDNLFKSFAKVDEELFEELEELLISADIGFNTTEAILDELRDIVKENRIKDSEEVKEHLYAILHRLVGKDTMRLCSFHYLCTPPEQTLVKINAWSALGDGVVEGTEYGDNILGVQGHPEADSLLPEIFAFLTDF